jgi:hypothetical protein
MKCLSVIGFSGGKYALVTSNPVYLTKLDSAPTFCTGISLEDWSCDMWSWWFSLLIWRALHCSLAEDLSHVTETTSYIIHRDERRRNFPSSNTEAEVHETTTVEDDDDGLMLQKPPRSSWVRTHDEYHLTLVSRSNPGYFFLPSLDGFNSLGAKTTQVQQQCHIIHRDERRRNFPSSNTIQEPTIVLAIVFALKFPK